MKMIKVLFVLVCLVLISSCETWKMEDGINKSAGQSSENASESIEETIDIDYNENFIDELNDKITNTKTIWEQPREATVDNFESIEFGNYYINDIAGEKKEPIEWVIMKKENNRALLLSRYVLDYHSYDDRVRNKANNYKQFNSDWKDSSLREWLNNYFYNESFNEYEKSVIQNTYLDNTYYYVKLIEDYEQTYLNTNDNVFILAIDELIDYPTFSGKNRKLTARATEFAKNFKRKGISVAVNKDNDSDKNHQKLDGDISPYWVRSSELYNMAYIFYSEQVADAYGLPEYGLPVDSNISSYGVRPAIWVSFDSSKYKEIEKLEKEEKQREIADREASAKNRIFDFATFSAAVENSPCVVDFPEMIKENVMPVVTFGNYYYFADEKRRDIDWIVLNKDIENRVALLISKDIIESVPYDDKPYYEIKYWENSYLRLFLNSVFYNDAFIDSEKAIILDNVTTNHVSKNQYGESVDKVSVPSEYEVSNYFVGVSSLAKEDTNNSKAVITPYAIEKSDKELRLSNSGFGYYWLRDVSLTGELQCMAPQGIARPVSNDYYKFKTVGVRPIIKVMY